jgi:hypothetical protein
MVTQTAQKVSLGFVIQQQEKVTWCWSAVGTSCALFYNSASGWTQCKMATKAIQPSPGNCCGETAIPACDVTWFLENSDRSLGSFIVADIANGFVKGAIPFAQVMAELDAKRPVAYRLKLDYEGMTMFHFVVIAGYEVTDAGKQIVSVYDSFFGNAEMEYSRFISNYKYKGSVTHTFLTTPNKSV